MDEFTFMPNNDLGSNCREGFRPRRASGGAVASLPDTLLDLHHHNETATSGSGNRQILPRQSIHFLVDQVICFENGVSKEAFSKYLELYPRCSLERDAQCDRSTQKYTNTRDDVLNITPGFCRLVFRDCW